MPEFIRRTCDPCAFTNDIHPLLQRVFSARGIATDQELDNSLKHLLPPTLKGLNKAVALLCEAVLQQQRVLVVGDFDADGATSCALSLLVLRAIGLQQIDFLVPNRFDFGYGLTPEIVDEAAQYQPDLMITVDNGIASCEGVNKANALGINVLITDHHLPPEKLPEAAAIVNPNQQGCEFPSKNLAGVGVIFYVLSALRAELRQQGWFVEQGIKEPPMADYLDLVALGTVADVVPLDRNNRILVAQGLQRLQAGYARPGILALLQVAGKDYRRTSSGDMGFVLGPRLNAAGRLDDMSVGIQCLLTDNADEAYELAVSLDDLNRDRRAIENSMQQEALVILESLGVTHATNTDDLPAAICLFDQNWHQGVVGILASRVKEKFNRPVIVFAPSGTEDGVLKGSARSISALHIRDTLDVIATRHPEILQKFGGHAMAAGLSLAQENFEKFADIFNHTVAQILSEEDLKAKVLTDGVLADADLVLPTAIAVEQAGPWGQQFPEPLFEGKFFLINQRLVGEKHLKMVLALDASAQQTVDAIAFNIDLNKWPDDSVEKVKVTYQLSINRFHGDETLQLIIRDLIN